MGLVHVHFMARKYVLLHYMLIDECCSFPDNRTDGSIVLDTGINGC